MLVISSGLSSPDNPLKISIPLLLKTKNEITHRFESRFILFDYVTKRQEYFQYA